MIAHRLRSRIAVALQRSVAVNADSAKVAIRAPRSSTSASSSQRTQPPISPTQPSTPSPSRAQLSSRLSVTSKPSTPQMPSTPSDTSAAYSKDQRDQRASRRALPPLASPSGSAPLASSPASESSPLTSPSRVEPAGDLEQCLESSMQPEPPLPQRNSVHANSLLTSSLLLAAATSRTGMNIDRH